MRYSCLRMGQLWGAEATQVRGYALSEGTSSSWDLVVRFEVSFSSYCPLCISIVYTGIDGVRTYAYTSMADVDARLRFRYIL